ncbi:hypothetical protein LWI28_012351 [Acer negundo]|uniref:Uncharacterized protein n=1 Tax=Acer negundo TaxID=4023 RepID=A0AAD5J9B5_ACENE|nr:hypothetical protein LWI28_012351 [Acer negundo]
MLSALFMMPDPAQALKLQNEAVAKRRVVAAAKRKAAEEVSMELVNESLVDSPPESSPSRMHKRRDGGMLDLVNNELEKKVLTMERELNELREAFVEKGWQHVESEKEREWSESLSAGLKKQLMIVSVKDMCAARVDLFREYLAEKH